MFRGLIGRVLMFIVIGAVFIAVWRANNGDLTRVADAIITVLNKGADVVTTLWNGFTTALGGGSTSTPTS